ncbi:hypothetical protein XELAEV_18004861mg [Xenopus laevis]|uniref:Uncharacterized protein n=1 Tax=Xenopus laevis TaxID=8355 RepID=A0A974DVS9_XENLA|nr:hypothetical protein XELAEV_18004861mg [Xenopus laevis]
MTIRDPVKTQHIPFCDSPPQQSHSHVLMTPVTPILAGVKHTQPLTPRPILPHLLSDLLAATHTPLRSLGNDFLPIEKFCSV